MRSVEKDRNTGGFSGTTEQSAEANRYGLTDSDERSFLLDSTLFLTLGPTLDPAASSPPPLSFAWLDPDGDSPDDEYEFILSPDTPARRAHDFEQLILRSMWEKDNASSWPTDRPSIATAEKQLETEYKCERVTTSAPAVAPSKAVPLFRPVTPDSSDDERPPRRAPVAVEFDEDRSDNDSGDELAAALLSKAVITPATASRPVKSPAAPAPKNAVASSSKSAVKASAVVTEKPGVDPAPRGITDAALVSAPGELHLFDRNSGMFMLQELETTLAIHHVDGGYWLIVQGKDGIWVSQGISIEMCLNFSVVSLSLLLPFLRSSLIASSKLSP